MATVTLARLRGITPRLYQETILSGCVSKNCLVVLPTGMGKTAIALLLSLQRMRQHPGSKVLFLAPTKPLCEQHMSTFKKHLDGPDDLFALFTGSVPPARRAELWQQAQFVFSTPQGLENDVISSRIDLRKCSLMIFDEAHRAVGDYSYVFLAKKYNARAEFPKTLALTASPGSEIEKVLEVCMNLFIEQVEVRTNNDPDVNPYVQQVDVIPVRVDLSDRLQEVRNLLCLCMKAKIGELKSYGLTKTDLKITKRELLAMQAELRRKMSSGDKDFETLKGISVCAELMKVQHALELIESQGLTPLMDYFDKVHGEARMGKSKAVKNLVQSMHFKAAQVKARRLYDEGAEHPKMDKVRQICAEEFGRNKHGKIIIFTQFRDTARQVKKGLCQVPGVFAEMFVGQAKKKGTGLTQKQQVEMLQQFTDGLFNVLIATCVAEEGLDIPSVDLVLFYEPVPSAIRTIQRRGRTGRHNAGKVMTLITRGTRDEAYAASARYKERNMNSILRELRTTLNRRLAQQPQATLTRFETQQQAKATTRIFVDYREKASATVKELLERGVDIRLEMLPMADYVISKRCGVEFKTQQDFVDSIIDGRLLQQLKSLKQAYERPVILVEGDGNIYTLRNVHPKAIQGMLTAIAVSYGIPILWTKDAKDTAQLLSTMAEREQNETTNEFSPHANKKAATLKDQQEYIVSALPNVGPALARQLLEEFGSVKTVLSASFDELKEVEGVGDKKARSIFDTANKRYEG